MKTLLGILILSFSSLSFAFPLDSDPFQYADLEKIELTAKYYVKPKAEFQLIHSPKDRDILCYFSHDTKPFYRSISPQTFKVTKVNTTHETNYSFHIELEGLKSLNSIVCELKTYPSLVRIKDIKAALGPGVKLHFGNVREMQ